MEKEISEELAHAYDAGYRIGYRQAQRDLSKRDKPKKVKHIQRFITKAYGNCPSCNFYIEKNGTHNFCECCGEQLDWSE